MSNRNCPICNQEIEASVEGYHNKKFIDNKKYQSICHCCANVPKMHIYFEKSQSLVVFKKFNINRLRTVQELVLDGWDIDTATKSLKAVRKSIKNNCVELEPKRKRIFSFIVIGKLNNKIEFRTGV